MNKYYLKNNYLNVYMYCHFKVHVTQSHALQ